MTVPDNDDADSTSGSPLGGYRWCREHACRGCHGSPEFADQQEARRWLQGLALEADFHDQLRLALERCVDDQPLWRLNPPQAMTAFADLLATGRVKICGAQHEFQPVPPLPTPNPVPPPKPQPQPRPPVPVHRLANLHVHLMHRCDRSNLNGTVRITGPERHEATAGADGWVHFLGIAPGSYTIDGVHPRHHPGRTGASAPAEADTRVDLLLDATISIAPAQAAYTVVLDRTGNPTAAFPKLEFRITNGPPNHLFDLQLSRSGAPAGGPGLAGSWVQADGRDARVGQPVFSSWSNGQTTLRLDGGGAAIFQMPLEWWRDQARGFVPGGADATYQVRVIAFSDGTPACTHSAVGTVLLRNNLVRYRLIDNGYVNGGTGKSIRMEFTVREPDTTEMYTFVQWMRGAFERWGGTPRVHSYRAPHTLYDIQHIANFPDVTVDRLHMDPRYWGGVYTISADKKTASATDVPSAGALFGDHTHGWDWLDFETRVHLNFEVPAAVTITRKEGSAPIFGIVSGNLANPQPITLGSRNWNTRVLQVLQPDGSVTLTHPNTFAGP